MNLTKSILLAIAVSASILLFAGCSSLRPVVDQTRFFVLTPMPSPEPGPATAGNGLAIGIGRVDLPEYLLRKQIASRSGSGEIQYSESSQWAERLDKGIERVLRANLASILGPTHQILAVWRRNEVRAEVYVSIQRFESDQRGEVTLDAQWRITSPGAGQNRKAAFSRIIKSGPALLANPDGAVGTLGDALGALSQEIADALSAASPAPR